MLVELSMGLDRREHRRGAGYIRRAPRAGARPEGSVKPPSRRPPEAAEGVIIDPRELKARVRAAIGKRYAIDDAAAQDREFARQRKIERDCLRSAIADELLAGDALLAAERRLEIMSLEDRGPS
jgi:hypothetical protein